MPLFQASSQTGISGIESQGWGGIDQNLPGDKGKDEREDHF